LIWDDTDEGRNTTLQEEFLSLLTHGELTSPLESFLLNVLKEQARISFSFVFNDELEYDELNMTL
jgi:hypothetical protein